MIRLVLVGALGLLVGCTTPPPKVPDAPVNDVVVAALFRGPCLGRCPEYQVEVLASGVVRWRGVRNVALVGEARGQLSPEQLEALDRLFADAGFAGFAARYENLDTTDLPLVIVAHRGKLVRHAHGDSGAPPELTKLEDAVDALVGTRQWVTGAVDR